MQNWFITACFACSFFWFPFPLCAGIILLICQYAESREIFSRYSEIEDIEKYRKDTDAYCEVKRKEIEELEVKAREIKQKEAEAEAKVLLSTVSVPVISKEITSEEYRTKYQLIKAKEKEMIKESPVVIMDDDETTKEQKEVIKLMLRCFNAETDAYINSITIKNCASVKNKIIKSFETLNKIGSYFYIAIQKEYLEIKLKQADFMYSFEYQKEQERLQQKEIREKMVEEEKVQREIEREKAKVEKEEKQFRKEIDNLMKRLRDTSEKEQQLYLEQIRELQEKLRQVEENKKNVLNREQNTRAGFVYVISNVGSFGDNVYKIGMTRRLDPMDRINELSSASVPFEFDVHAIIFSEDAPALEAALHNKFADKRVNLVNKRKEFFRVTLKEIERTVKSEFNATVEFTKTARAEQFRETQRLLATKN